MLGFATVLFLVSPIAFLAGLVNPKWVLLGNKRTRLKSSAVYSGVFVASLVIAGMAAPPQAKQENQPSSASSGKCNFPDDLDSSGRRCGKRAASVRPGGN